MYVQYTNIQWLTIFHSTQTLHLKRQRFYKIELACAEKGLVLIWSYCIDYPSLWNPLIAMSRCTVIDCQAEKHLRQLPCLSPYYLEAQFHPSPLTHTKGFKVQPRSNACLIQIQWKSLIPLMPMQWGATYHGGFKIQRYSSKWHVAISLLKRPTFHRLNELPDIPQVHNTIGGCRKHVSSYGITGDSLA